MKIGLLGPAYPFRGGIAKFSKLLANELGLHHKIKFFSFKKQYPKFIFPGKTQVEYGDKPDFNIISQLTPYNPFTWARIVKTINFWEPDLLIVSYWIPFFAPSFGYITRHLNKNTKIYFILHNVEFHEKWLFGNMLTKYTLKKADKLITLSNSVYKHTNSIFPSKEVIKAFHPTYNCYDQTKFTISSAKNKLKLTDKKVILFFGYIKPYKGLDILIEAFSLFKNKFENSHLLIVGEVYGNSETYLKLIKKKNLKEDVTFIDRFVADDEIELYFKAADVLALPYKQATQSGVVQIAYDMNLGAVATPIGGLPELVVHKKTGIVAKTTKPTDFSEALIEYFSLEHKDIKQNIKDVSENYSWDSFANLIMQ